MNESAKILLGEKNKMDFYGSHVGILTSTDIERGLTPKILYESNEQFCRLEARRDKLKENLEKFGEEIFRGYARISLPSRFVQECKREIVERARLNKKKISTFDYDLCPDRKSGFHKIAANVKGKPRSHKVSPENLELFYSARKMNLLFRFSRFGPTKLDPYSHDIDDVVDEVIELIAIRITLNIWKRKKWPKIVLDDLLKEAKNERTFELQRQFKRIYFLVLENGRNSKLPRLKFNFR